MIGSHRGRRNRSSSSAASCKCRRRTGRRDPASRIRTVVAQAARPRLGRAEGDHGVSSPEFMRHLCRLIEYRDDRNSPLRLLAERAVELALEQRPEFLRQLDLAEALEKDLEVLSPSPRLRDELDEPLPLRLALTAVKLVDRPRQFPVGVVRELEALATLCPGPDRHQALDLLTHDRGLHLSG